MRRYYLNDFLSKSSIILVMLCASFVSYIVPTHTFNQKAHSATTVPATIIEGIQSARKLSHLIYHFYHVFYLNEMIVKIS